MNALLLLSGNHGGKLKSSVLCLHFCCMPSATLLTQAMLLFAAGAAAATTVHIARDEQRQGPFCNAVKGI